MVATASVLSRTYSDRRKRCLVEVSKRLEEHIRGHLEDVPRIDRITCRAKSVDSFIKKAEKREPDGLAKYEHPLEDIQDQVGARIVVFYKSDVEVAKARIEQYFGAIESRRVVADSPREFGYEGRHYILFLPLDVFTDHMKDSDRPKVFELQIKTLFQHAWSEAEHDLGYKYSESLSFDQKRMMAFSAAQAWGADKVFQDLINQNEKVVCRED